jgi:Calcineurin-like phosphoesterase
MRHEDKKDFEENLANYMYGYGSELVEKIHQKTNRSVALNVAREQLFLQQLKDSLTTMLSKKFPSVAPYKPHKKKVTQRILNAALGDLHFGAMLDPREVPFAYTHTEEARRMAAVVQQIAEYKRQYRDETELFVHLLGDLIQNHLYDPRDGAPNAEQISTAIYLLTQALSFLATQFKQVTVFCTPGNHGRDTARHQERAVCQKWDSLETVIYFAVKTAVAHIPNIVFNIPYTPYYSYTTFGMGGFVTHGDTVITPGFPNKAINVENVRKQINEINSKREIKDRYVLFIVGHVHVYSFTKISKDTQFMSNGCLLPTDSYAQSKGLQGTCCCQAIWETVPEHMVGDQRQAEIDEYTDKDAALDKIIKPFNEF